MDQILRLNEFFVEGGKQDVSHVLLHINEPSDQEEMKKGYFFALSEINNASLSFITKLQEIIDRAETEYYLIPNDVERDPFELVLEKMNSESYILEHEQGELNSIVGAIRENEIIFSFYGNPHLLLFYKNKQGLYQKMDLVKSGSEGGATNGQLFGQVVQGKLSPNDFLFVGTPHIADFFSHDRLEKIITTRSAEESAGHIQKVLGELRNGFSFGGLIINLFQEEKTQSTVRAKPATGSSSKSLQKLFNREQETAETLSPSILPKLDKIRGILNNPEPLTEAQNQVNQFKPAQIKSAHLTNRPRRIPEISLAERLNSFGKIAWVGIKYLAKFIYQIILLIYSLIYNLLSTIILLFVVAVNYQNRRNTILENWRMQWRSRKEGFKQLPLITKTMLIGSILMAVFLAGSIVVIQHRQKTAAEEASFGNLIQEIRSKIASVRGAITYKNDDIAYADYRIAADKFGSLVCKTNQQKNQCSALDSELKELGTDLRKVTNANLTTLVTFDTLPKTGKEGLIRIKNKLVAYSPATSTLFVYDLLSNESKTIPTYPSITGFWSAAAPKENDFVLFVYNKRQLVKLNMNDLSVGLSEISFPTEKSDITSFVVYNRRLYVLDISDNTILKHDAIKTGFGLGQEWLKDKNLALSDAFDITIDGDIFITKNNGSIIKLTSGLPQNFSVFGIDPAINSPAKIWTYTDVPYLYVLEPAQKRLMVFEKDGHFVGQYTSDSLQLPTGFSVDHTSKIVYLLDGQKISKFSIK